LTAQKEVMLLDFLFGALKELAHPAMVLFFCGTGKLVQGR